MRARSLLAAVAAAMTLVGASASVASADDITNSVDLTVDAAVETMPLSIGGTGTTVLSVVTTNSDGKNGCNLTGATTFSASVASSDTTVATLSPSSVTFTSCGDTRTLTVSALKNGTSTISLTQTNNSTGGSFDLAPATFVVRVAPPANSAPTVAVSGVAAGASYEFGNVPVARCEITDKEDGNTSVLAGLSPITGPQAAHGLGSQTASCAVTDTGGLSATAATTYSIVDTTKPLVTVGAPEAAEAMAPRTPVTFSATASDNVDGVIIPVCRTAAGDTFAPGDAFPVGITTLTCVATDKAGNIGTSEPFAVVITDTTAPTVTTSRNIVAGNNAAKVTYDPASASDLVDGSVPVTCIPGSGTTFTLGTTTVTCTATDHAGNTGRGTFTVEIQDRTAPVVVVPDDVTAEATGPSGAQVSYGAATATDDVDGSLPVSCNPTSPAMFPLGTTTVTCAATDKAGNTGDNTFTVSVEDTTSPAIDVPADIAKEATSAAGATVDFETSASDVVDGVVATKCDADSGATFPLGLTNVVCGATDAAGNKASTSFSIRVQDTTAPSLTVSDDLVAEAIDAEGAHVDYDEPTATDIVDGVVQPR